MTTEAFKAHLNATPFHPFMVHLNDGRIVKIGDLVEAIAQTRRRVQDQSSAPVLGCFCSAGFSPKAPLRIHLDRMIRRVSLLPT